MKRHASARVRLTMRLGRADRGDAPRPVPRRGLRRGAPSRGLPAAEVEPRLRPGHGRDHAPLAGAEERGLLLGEVGPCPRARAVARACAPTSLAKSLRPDRIARHPLHRRCTSTRVAHGHGAPPEAHHQEARLGVRAAPFPLLAELHELVEHRLGVDEERHHQRPLPLDLAREDPSQRSSPGPGSVTSSSPAGRAERVGHRLLHRRVDRGLPAPPADAPTPRRARVIADRSTAPRRRRARIIRYEGLNVSSVRRSRSGPRPARASSPSSSRSPATPRSPRSR